MVEKRIYFHDTDAGGVVYYANYLKYMEEARVNFFQEHGLSEIQVEGTPVFFPVSRCVISYHKPAYYGETIQCTALPTKVSAARIIFTQQVIQPKTKAVLVEAEVTLACVNAKTFRPMRLPETVQKKIYSCFP